MRKTFIFINLFVLYLFSSGFIRTTEAQVVQNQFADGNWIYYSDHCWGIGPNTTVYSTVVTNNGFNNSSVCETDNLGQKSPCVLLSPWLTMNGNDQITFTHALTDYSGIRTLKVYLVNHPSLVEELLWTYNYTDGNVHTNTISHSKEGVFRVKWEWVGSGGNSRGQLDNVVIGGTYDSDPSDECRPQQHPAPDTDTDGVKNNQDDYITDMNKAYNSSYVPADTGTLVFEDLWPNYGDYDLNDMVVGYKFKVVSNAQHYVSDLYVTFVLRAAGAVISNGFAFQLPNVNPASIISTTGYDVLPESGFDLSANGTENGQSFATIIVFDDAKRFMPEGNTEEGMPLVPYQRFNMHIKFMNNGVPGPGGPVTLSTLNVHGFNPFIIVGGNRGKEVHLPGYPPTGKANLEYFGTGDDDTNPAAGKYYQSATNLPWALNILDKFDYPIEKRPITHGHLHFSDWAESGGTLYKDWYSDKPGYRNQNNIY